MTRAVPLTSEQARSLEALGLELFRKGDDRRASMVLAIVLAWRVAPVVSDRFECDVDESAGMAEVIQLQGYSRRAPCA